MSEARGAFALLREAASAHPGWRDHAPLLGALRHGETNPEALTALLPEGTCTESGHRVRFRDADTLPRVDYERHIHETGEVPTRRNDAHDIANALAWACWPRLKSALNTAHCRELKSGGAPDGRRGPVRDALTLFDESGAVIVSNDRNLLEALALHDWHRAFRGLRSAWLHAHVFMFGHAVLEKLVRPFKAMTAHALLVEVGSGWRLPQRGHARSSLDGWLAERLRASALLRHTGTLSPLPVAGIPGWWPHGDQNEGFYDDVGVFRPPAPGRVPVRPIAWTPSATDHPPG